MPTLLYTVQNLVDEVRSQLDEVNVESIDTNADILPALNRAQDFAFDILARKYPEPILKYTSLDLVGGQSEYDIPEDVFEDRISKLEISVPSGQTPRSTYREVQRISYRDLTDYESASESNIPYYYAIYGRKIKLVPTPTGVYSCRMWYLRNPEKLVLPQGRITVVNGASNYVLVDSAGSSLVTEADQLGSYVNFVDGQSGEIRGSAQIQINSSNKLTFRTSPLRTTVLNREILGDLTDITELLVDDYIAPIDGTCVPYFSKPTSNFIIQYAVAELTRKLGGAADMESKVLEKFEQQVERTWAGRETTLRVKKRSHVFGRPIKRWYFE